MNSLAAFAMGEANRGKESMVFDWHKAAELIKKHNGITVSAGLSGDWDYTGGQILENGKIVPAEDTYVYLASTWARPEIEIDGDIQDCFLMETDTPGWSSDTYWPESAVAILEG